MCRNASALTPPGRRIVGTGVHRSSTVDSTPTSHGPLSRISGTRPSRSVRACCAVVGLTCIKRLALGAAIGEPVARIRASATAWRGMRTATVDKPAVTSLGTRGLAGSIIVSGPGQNIFARSFACSGSVVTSVSNASTSAICTIKGSL